MAIRKYVSRGYNNYNKSASVLNKPVGSSYIPTQVKEEEEEQNAFGFLGGLGYLGEKLAVGAVSSIEGITDYTFSGLAKLFGNDAWAEDIIKNDWFGDWYSHPEEWFNPDQGWQVAGDVAGGIGSSLPSMAAAVGLTVATGGGAAPAAASFLVSGLGAAGRATKEAYEKTGKLTGKEYGYGALVGATEGGVEALGNLLSLGSGAVVKSVSKAIGKETAEAFAKQGILKTLGSSFAGEAFEEGFSEFITPYWQRATYDPKAKNASADEILYAGLVGGLSGVAMGGGGYVINNVTSFAKGNKLTISGGDAQVLATAGDFASFEELNQTGDELFSDIANKRKSLLESLSKTNGKAVTIQQKRDLGALERANIAGSMKLFVATRAQNIVNNAPLIAERLTAFGYKTADGKPIRFTAEEITAGYDSKKPSSIYKALQTNSKLRELAVADATGRLMMDTNQFKKNALMGQKLASQVDINRFYEQASREELQAVTDALKIDSWSSLTPEIFNQKITDFINDGGVQRTLEAKERKAAFASLTPEGAQNVPKIVNLGKDGMRRYTDGQLDIAVERKGDKYTLYNYKTDNLSKEMKREEINKFFRDYSNQKEEYLAAERERLEVEQKRRAEFEGIETMLRDNVSEYKTLNAPSQSMIRRLVREGRAKGVSDSDLLMYAKVSAHSGIDIQFDKEANYRGVKKDGSADYADGFYEAAKNRIVVNPEGKRTAERLLIHELDHAITKNAGNNRKKVLDMYKTAIKNTDKQLQEDIAENYAKDKILYETKARYAEQVLGNKYTLEKLIEAEPTLKDKILSFFKGASTDYADVPKLSSAAKKYYRTYKKLFDEFSARNAENNAIEKPLTSMNQENMQDSDRQYAVGEQKKFAEYNKPITTADTDSIHSIASQKRKLGQSLSVNAFAKEDIEVTQKWAHKFYQELGVKSPFFRAWYGDWRSHDKSQRKIVSVPTIDISDVVLSTGDYKIDDTGWTVYAGKTLNDDTRHHTGGNKINVKSLSTIDEILNNAILLDTVASEPDTNKKSPNTAFLHKLYTLIEYEGQTYIAKTTVEEFYNQGKNGVSRKAYNLKAIKIEPAGGQFRIKNSSSSVPVTDSIYSISDLYDFVKGYDKDFTPAPEISPLLLNEDGTPKVFYHGTNAEFTQFDLLKSGSNFGKVAEGMFFFTDKKQAYPNSAKDYAREAVKTKGGTERIYEVYLSLKKPLVIDSKFSYDPVSYYDANQEKIYEQYFNGDYDGIIVRDSTGKSSTSTLVIVDDATKIKSATDNIGTFSKYEGDIRYALDIEAVDREDSNAVERYESNRKLATKPLEGEVVTPPSKNGEIAKIKAQVFSDKAYNKSDVEKALKNTRLVKVLSGQQIESLTNEVWVALNEAGSEEKRTKVVREAIYKIINYSDEQLRNKNILLENESTIQDLVVSLANEFKTLLDSGKQTYKGKLEDRYQKKNESLKKKYQKKTDKLLENAENLKIRTTADYTTDKVFTQASVKRNFDNVEAVKNLSDDVRNKIARDLWIELEMSDDTKVRDTFVLKYSVALYQAIKDSDSKVFENMSPADKDVLQSELRYAIEQIVKSGRKSKLTKIKAEAGIASELKSVIYHNLVIIDDRKKLRFIEASGYKGDLFKGTLDSLTRIDWRGKFSSNIARAEIEKLAQWYTEENPMLKGFETKDENSKKTVTTNFSHDIRGMLEMLSEGEGDFSNTELKMLSDVTGYFAKLVNEYDRVYIEGKWQDGEALAKELINNVHQQERAGVPIAIRAMRNKLLSAGFRTFGDALSVMKLADMYGNGIYTRYYNEWLQGEINADAEAMKIKEKYDAFMKNDRKYLANAEKEVVNLHGVNVRKIDLISYAMTLKRKQAWESIAEGGVVFQDPKDGNDNHIYPAKDVTKGEGYSKRLESAMKAELDRVMSMLSEKDVDYMKVLEEGFELARTTKAMGDMQRLGFASVIEGYYYPIMHADTDHLSNFVAELIATDRYANASFNKNQTEGAKSAIRIKSADSTFNSHVKGVSRYLYLSPVMDSFNKLYKLKVGEESLQRAIKKSKTAWRQDGKLVGFDYLQNLMLDTMGMGKNVGDDFAARLRGAAVTFSLGANPKVLVTQFSSLISSTSILSYGSHFKALGIWNGNVDNYSVVAKLRNSDYTVAKAEGVIDRINTWSRVFTAGISLIDRFVVYRSWAACQAEVAKNKGPAVGTEENRIKAGKLLDKVILETQQNSLTSRRTEGARRGNILTKQVQMYKSDAITSFGRAVDSWGEMNYLGALLKSNTLTDAERGTIQNRFEESKKKLAKSVGSILGQAAFMMLVTEIFRNFYGKNDDETEEEKRTRLVVDAIGNLVNGVPVVSEVWSTITSNFGFETMEFSALNDFFDTAKGVIDYTEKRLEGKATERDGNKLMQNLLYTAGQLTGVPTRNMKNVSYGVVRLFSKDAAYKWDNALYKKSYSADLNEAVAKGDMNRATMIMELALGEKLGGGFSTEAIGELTRLAGLGEKIIPGAISDTITVNGEEFVLSTEQYEAVKAEYDKVISAVNSFVESKFYNSLTDDQKAKALRKLYSTYKDVSYDRALGTQKNPKANLISSLLGENVFNAYLTLGVIESDVDDNGNTISGSKRAKVVKAIGALGVSVEERLLLICASGYALKDGDVRGLSADGAKKRLLKYILNLRGLSADDRAEIAVMCGFEVRNGKIINNFSKKLKKISKK